MASSMSLLEFLSSNMRYFADAELRLPRRVVAPNIPGLHADLHAHPYIDSLESLEDTLDIMQENGLNLLAITAHGRGNDDEMDYYRAKELFKQHHIDHEDLGIAMSIPKRSIILVPAYESSVRVTGVRGTVDVVALMPNNGFEKRLRDGWQFSNFKELCTAYDAITIGVHSYTVHDPYGPFGFFKFRLADHAERERIKSTIFRDADSVDFVASNAAWMIHSNELVAQDYHGKLLANSDTHGQSHYTRSELGRARSIFHLKNPGDGWDGWDFREVLRQALRHNDFETDQHYTPSLKFFKGVALG